jgi:hypothetical protein
MQPHIILRDTTKRTGDKVASRCTQTVKKLKTKLRGLLYSCVPRAGSKHFLSPAAESTDVSTINPLVCALSEMGICFMEFTASWRSHDSLIRRGTSFCMVWNATCGWSRRSKQFSQNDPYIGPLLCVLNHDYSDFMPYKQWRFICSYIETAVPPGDQFPWLRPQPSIWALGLFICAL